MDERVRKESSIAASTRVSIVDLARVHEFWTRRGEFIRSMSHLINRTFMEMADQLTRQGYMDESQIESVMDAHHYLKAQGLYQASHLKRGGKRIAMALSFETLRNEGHDPIKEHPKAYNQMHKDGSIESKRGPDHLISDNEWARIQRQRAEDRKKKFEAEKERALKRMEENGQFACDPGESDEEWMRKRQAKDAARIAAEKQEPDWDNLPTVEDE